MSHLLVGSHGPPARPRNTRTSSSAADASPSELSASTAGFASRVAASSPCRAASCHWPRANPASRAPAADGRTRGKARVRRAATCSTRRSPRRHRPPRRSARCRSPGTCRPHRTPRSSSSRACRQCAVSGATPWRPPCTRPLSEKWACQRHERRSDGAAARVAGRCSAGAAGRVGAPHLELLVIDGVAVGRPRV